jgi:hypothetical protein
VITTEQNAIEEIGDAQPNALRQIQELSDIVLPKPL